MSDGPSRAEFAAFSERVYHTMEAGFAGVLQRLDALNGRTGKIEVSDADLQARVKSIEKEVFPRRRRTDAIADAENTTALTAPLTKRETAIATAGMMIIMALVRLAELLGTKLWTVLTQAK